jgi:hypothetical protein
MKHVYSSVSFGFRLGYSPSLQAQSEEHPNCLQFGCSLLQYPFKKQLICVSTHLLAKACAGWSPMQPGWRREKDERPRGLPRYSEPFSRRQALRVFVLTFVVVLPLHLP